MAPGDKVHPDVGNSRAPAGAYYSVKDQPLPAPATFRGRRRGRSPCCCCFASLCGIFVFLCVAIGIAVLVFWLAVQPRLPKFNIQDVNISGLSFAPNGSTVNVNTTFTVMARNPNKKIGIYYDTIDVNVQTMGVTIGDGQLPSFYQGHKNTTYIDGHLTSENVAVSSSTESDLVQAVKNDSLPLNVAVDVRARVKIGSWKSKRFTVKVRCTLSVNPNISSGSQVVGSPSCKVKR